MNVLTHVSALRQTCLIISEPTHVMDVTQEEQTGLAMSTDDERLDNQTINIKSRNGVKRDKLIYGITDAPPIYVTLLCGLQVCMHILTF